VNKYSNTFLVVGHVIGRLPVKHEYKPHHGMVGSLSNRLYPHCLVLVGYMYRIECD